MKNILIIVANPKKSSFSFAMANQYKTIMLPKNNQVDILDLYRDKNQQNFFTYDNSNNPTITKEMNYEWTEIMLRVKAFLKTYVEEGKTILKDGFQEVKADIFQKYYHQNP